jgi:hypothetical protein
MRHFLGLRGSAAYTISTGGDVTPDAVNWSNVNAGSSTALTLGQLITGISSSITLRLNISGNGFDTIQYGTNSTNSVPATFTTIGSGSPFTGNTSTFIISNNTWLWFRLLRGVQGTCILTTVTVTNTSDSNATLDTFTVLSGAKGGCP